MSIISFWHQSAEINLAETKPLRFDAFYMTIENHFGTQPPTYELYLRVK